MDILQSFLCNATLPYRPSGTTDLSVVYMDFSTFRFIHADQRVLFRFSSISETPVTSSSSQMKIPEGLPTPFAVHWHNVSTGIAGEFWYAPALENVIVTELYIWDIVTTKRSNYSRSNSSNAIRFTFVTNWLCSPLQNRQQPFSSSILVSVTIPTRPSALLHRETLPVRLRLVWLSGCLTRKFTR